MRLNTYVFPENTNEKDMFLNNMSFEINPFVDNFGNEWKGECNAENVCKRFNCIGLLKVNDVYEITEEDYEKAYELCKKLNIIKQFAERKIDGVSVTFVKNMIKKYGGYGLTYHIDRDGSVFETSEIRLNRNNSSHKYNQHL